MKKLVLTAAAVLLLAASPAPAKTVTVDISKVGFVPGAVTIQSGDSITWTNKDTANHQVVCSQCSPAFTSPVLAANATYTATFSKTGKFTTVDPLNKNKKGTVTVTAAPAGLTAAVAPKAVVYGRTTVVSGTLSTAQANQKIDILAQPCGENAAKLVTTVTTGTGGAYTYTASPALGTAYQARFKPAGATAVTSTPANVVVRPVLRLSRLARNTFSVQVTAAQSFVGKAITFQRYILTKRRWVTVKTVFLSTKAAATTPLAGTTVSSATFHAKIRRGTRVHALLPAGQAAPCYLGAKSGTILG
jgi:plastocyanin